MSQNIDLKNSEDLANKIIDTQDLRLIKKLLESNYSLNDIQYQQLNNFLLNEILSIDGKINVFTSQRQDVDENEDKKKEKILLLEDSIQKVSEYKKLLHEIIQKSFYLSNNSAITYILKKLNKNITQKSELINVESKAEEFELNSLLLERVNEKINSNNLIEFLFKERIGNEEFVTEFNKQLERQLTSNIYGLNNSQKAGRFKKETLEVKLLIDFFEHESGKEWFPDVDRKMLAGQKEQVENILKYHTGEANYFTSTDSETLKPEILSKQELTPLKKLEEKIIFCLSDKKYISNEEVELLILLKDKRIPEIKKLINSMTQEEKEMVVDTKSAINIIENIINNFDEGVGKIKTSIKMIKMRDLSANVKYSDSLKGDMK